ncbi:MAG: hypothetical protein U1E76_02690, partial [Planctomycetota bacterium]
TGESLEVNTGMLHRHAPDGKVDKMIDDLGDARAADGTLSLSVWSGESTLQLVANDHEPFVRPLALDPGDVLDLGTQPLRRRATIAGRIVDASGARVACALELIDRERPADRPKRVSQSDERDLHIDAARSRYDLVVIDGRWAVQTVAVDARLGDVSGLAIAVEPGTAVHLCGTSDTSLRVEDDQGKIVWSGTVVDGDDGKTIGLHAGHYRLIATAQGGAPHKQEFEVGSDPVTLLVPR